MISIMISGLKYLLALTSYYQKKKVFSIAIQEKGKGFYDYEYKWDQWKASIGISGRFWLYQRGRNCRRRKSSRKDSENSGQFWRGESSGRIFFWYLSDKKSKAESNRAIHKRIHSNRIWKMRKHSRGRAGSTICVCRERWWYQPCTCQRKDCHGKWSGEKRYVPEAGESRCCGIHQYCRFSVRWRRGSGSTCIRSAKESAGRREKRSRKRSCQLW